MLSDCQNNIRKNCIRKRKKISNRLIYIDIYYLDKDSLKCEYQNMTGKLRLVQNKQESAFPMEYKDFIECGGNLRLENHLTWVYFVKMAGLPYIKIGRSATIKSRFKTLDSYSPVGLIILGYFATTDHAEYLLHKQFSGTRTKGEWFKESNELLELIKEINLGYTPEDLYFPDKPRHENIYGTLPPT